MNGPLRKIEGCAIILNVITKTKKQKIIAEVAVHKTDTGSAPVQIAILTRKIEELALHLKKHAQDNHSRRGLLKMVSERQKHMRYLEKKSPKAFAALMKTLGMKKKTA